MKFLLVALATLFVLAGCGGSSAEDRLVGEWVGTDALGQEMRLRFASGSPMKLRITLVDARGKNAMNGTCTVDFEQRPAHFNIQLDGRGEIQTILSFVNDDTLRFENIGSSTPRPSEFSGDAMTLARK